MQESKAKEKNWAWESYMILGYRITEDKKQDKVFNDWINKAINEAKREVFDDIGRIGLSSCGFMGEGDNLCDRIEIEEIAKLKQKHLGERK